MSSLNRCNKAINWEFWTISCRIRPTRWITKTPLFLPFPYERKKTLREITSRVFWVVMSEVCPCFTKIHFHSEWYLTHQTNINFPLFSGLSVWVWTNSDIARLIRSEWLIWYLSHKVVISSLRTSGNLRQVWCGCFFIVGNSPYSNFWMHGFASTFRAFWWGLQNG